MVLRGAHDRAPGFDPSDAVEFWDQVNREDWHVCELTQQGMASSAYEPGRYTTQEGDVHDVRRDGRRALPGGSGVDRR